MTWRALSLGALALAGLAGSAAADRYEASIAIQPQGGVAWVGEDGASSARVTGAGFSMRATYGLRDWLAVEGELGAMALSSARYDEVEVSVGGAPVQPEALTRTTRTTRLAVGATARLGVAWVPTLGLGFGIQPSIRDDATVVGSDLVPDGREGGVSVRPIAFAQAGLDHRLSARWVVGVNARGQHDGTIASLEVGVAVARYWYPSW